MANTIYPFSNLTGGTDDSYLDYFDGNDLVDGDFAFGVDTDGIQRTYKLDASSGASENSPYVISPDTNAGTKRWILMVPGGPLSHVSAQTSTSRSVPNSTYTTLIFETSTEDVLSELNTTNGRFTATYDGRYLVNGAVAFQNATWSTNTKAFLAIAVNGTRIKYGYNLVAQTSTTVQFFLEITKSITLSAGDYLEFQIWHSQGSTLSTAGDAGYEKLTIDRLV